jgi:peptidoglycan hydrolase-like protein with peptidoglycan-binding domain
VRKLQNSLASAGYDIGSSGADGIYGASTEKAVRQYQRDNGLSVDGIAGEQTQGKLYGAAQEQTPAQSGSEPSSAEKALPQFNYDPATDTAYQQALAALQQAQQSMPSYQASYDQQLQNVYDQIVNRKPFQYNVNEDALYQQYRDQYAQMGQMAMMDTMGQAAGLTGGYGSSYAQAAGQQAYQGYLQKLNEVVPELYGMARDAYDQEGQNLMNQYAMLGDMADTEYGRYQDQLNQYWQNLNFAKDQADDAYNRGYGQAMDKLAYDQWATEFAEDKRRYDQEWELALEQYRNSGKGSSSGTKETPIDEFPGYVYEPIEHGMSEEQIRQLQMAAGLEVTGQWDADTEAAYMAVYGTEPPKGPQNGPDTSLYDGWDAGMWEGYFASIRKEKSAAEAEEELNYLISKGLIPKNMVVYAASGARGGKTGH